MARERKNTKAFMGAIHALRQFIRDNDYENGGWLPPGREMAERLEVSHPTYCKALNLLDEEGIVHGYPKKGHYVVPYYLRRHKVGLILDTGKELPFVHMDSGLTEAMEYLRANGYSLQLIQAAQPEQLHDNAEIMGMLGLIWFCPPPKATEVIRDINTKGEIPLVVVQSHYGTEDFGNGRVRYDSQQASFARLHHLLGLGHKQIAYIGSLEDARRLGLIEECTKHGCTLLDKHCLPDELSFPEQIVPMVRDEKITGILSEGAGIRAEALFTELSKLPDELMPEVVMTYFTELPILAAKYPRIKLRQYEKKLTSSLGLAAAKMLVDRLQNGTPLRTLSIGYEE